MRVLHIGNIANNAYNIAKALRERTDIEADCFTDHYQHYISQPEWEDADIEVLPKVDEYSPVDWNSLELGGFTRPAWYLETRAEALKRYGNLDWPQTLLRMNNFIQNIDNKKKASGILDIAANYHNITSFSTDSLIKIIWGELPTKNLEWAGKNWKLYLHSIFKTLCMPPHRLLSRQDYVMEDQPYLMNLFSRYDIIQTYGVHQIFYPILLSPSIPHITFEHGTMREFPFQNSSLGRKSMLAYKRAFANIITNADAIHNARKMGLSNYTFIPHPVDDTKFKPIQDEKFRSSLLEKNDATGLFLAPARQNWGLKGNDKIILAFAQLIKKTGPGPKLLLGAWGQEVERSAQLIKKLDLSSHIIWLPPIPKRLLARYINACDAVLDQFVLGAFGTTTPEAMACAKPVLLFYNQSDHEWCFSVPPPVINVHEISEIADKLLRLIENPEWGREIGRRSLAWFQQYHSMDIVIDRHVEIYKKVCKNAISIPASVITGNQKMKKLRIICFIDARAAVSADIATWINGVQGKSALEILNIRLKQIYPSCQFLMALAPDNSDLEKEARCVGWDVIIDNGQMRYFAPNPTDIGLESLNKADFIYICSLDEPFMVASQHENCKILDYNPDAICSMESKTNPYVPKKIYSRAFIKFRSTLNDIFEGQFTEAQCQSIMNRYGANFPAPELPETTLKIKLNNYQELLPQFSPENFDPETIETLAAPEELLQQAINLSKEPANINAELNTFETQARRTKLNSFPTFVGLNLTSICSARCSFCSIQPKTQKKHDAFTLDEIKKMDWLKHVQTLAIWGGIGDSLVNKEFVPIVNYLHNTFPKLKLDLSTNGILLNENICQTLATSLYSFNVSLNAATAPTWEKLMRAKGFENVCMGIKRIAELRKNSVSPSIAVSFVLTRDNIHEATDFVDLAKNLGADRVTFVHYVPTTLVGKRELPADQSLYFNKQFSDEMLSRAALKAQELGILYTGPTPFNKKADYIHFGARAMTPSPACCDPWRTSYLTVDEDGNRQMIFCCSSFYYSIKYDKSQLDEHNFHRIWNHPVAQYFRKTVNRKGANPICSYCNSIDRFNPKNCQNYEINAKIQPLFAEIDQRYQKGENIEPDEISAKVDNIFGVRNDC